MNKKNQFKNSALSSYYNGLSKNQICKDNNISLKTLYNWINEEKKLSKDNRTNTEITYKEYANLKKNNEHLKELLNIHKDILNYFNPQLKDRLECLVYLNQRYDNVHSTCKALDVDRGTYYNHIKKPEMTFYQIRDEEFKIQIKEIFDMWYGQSGAAKIKIEMNKRGFKISERKIQKLMKDMNLKCNQRKGKKEYDTPLEQTKYSMNKLDRNFNPTEPNKVWVSDITYCKTKDGMCYICVVIDLFARKVISWEVSTSITSCLVSTAFFDAYIKRSSPNELMYHSNQGSQYTSNSFREKLNKLGVEQSYSKKAQPHDNAVAESFNKTLKVELLNKNQYPNRAELDKALRIYIKFYNEERLHKTLGYLTPEEKEAEYFKTK